MNANDIILRIEAIEEKLSKTECVKSEPKLEKQDAVIVQLPDNHDESDSGLNFCDGDSAIMYFNDPINCPGKTVKVKVKMGAFKAHARSVARMLEYYEEKDRLKTNIE